MNMKTSFSPTNKFEIALMQTKAGDLAIPNFIQEFLEASLAIPSAKSVSPDGNGFEPLIFPKEKIEMLSVFSDKSRIGDFGKIAPYCLVMKGSDFVTRIPPGCGIVVNPGWDTGFEISPDGVSKIKSDFLSA
jgi:hypothetical protein